MRLSRSGSHPVGLDRRTPERGDCPSGVVAVLLNSLGMQLEAGRAWAMTDAARGDDSTGIAMPSLISACRSFGRFRQASPTSIRRSSHPAITQLRSKLPGGLRKR